VEQLARTVRDAATRPEVRDAVMRLYAAVQKEIDTRRPLCVISGRCCRFEEYGHRLYVTTIELAAFTYGLEKRTLPRNVVAGESRQPPAPRSATMQLPLILHGPFEDSAEPGRVAPGGPEAQSSLGMKYGHLIAANPGGCPFQTGKLCGVHPIRPFGCRMFFCDATATEWQNQAYERFHAELKTLHDQLSVPYYYVEWRSALSVLGLR
jgi:Fe-S-cluster containining protein